MNIKKNMKRSFPVLIMTTIIMLSMVAPNTVIATEEVQTVSPFAAMPTAAPYKAALVLGGDETDLGFSYVAINAINKLNETFGWDIAISRQTQYADQYGTILNYAAAGYDVIFCVGGQFIETLYFSGLTNNYNDTLFVQIPGLNEYAPKVHNVVGLHPAFQTEGMYLAGVLSGSMSETERLGVVFGEWYEYLSMEFYAFKAGVESVNEDALVYARVAGTWGDAAIGKSITATLIDVKNVDIVVQVADTTGRGVIAACQEANITVIGTVADQAVLAPDNTMTSIGMDTYRLMGLVAEYVENGTAMAELGNSSWDLPIGNYLYPYHHYDDIIPQAVKDLVDETALGIANGSIYVPRIGEDDPPVDPVDPLLNTTTPTTDPPTDEPTIPGFSNIAPVSLITMLGVMVIVVKKSRRVA
jgi:basic membrane lipoprotein Med (substrate-binding protein (PBP1-ABC) superfamily)